MENYINSIKGDIFFFKISNIKIMKQELLEFYFEFIS